MLCQCECLGFGKCSVIQQDVNVRGSWVKGTRELSVLALQFCQSKINSKQKLKKKETKAGEEIAWKGWPQCYQPDGAMCVTCVHVCAMYVHVCAMYVHVCANKDLGGHTVSLWDSGDCCFLIYIYV